MLRSMNSPRDHHDDHLRHLIDQRSARADLHSRYPSVSEYSTPSVYSPTSATFSPVPFDRENTLVSKVVGVGSLSQGRSPPYTTIEPRTTSDREFLNDPAASALDLEDDCRSSYTSSNTYEDDDEPNPDSAEEEDSRMSMLGPKMRFHGRAPWEMGEDTLEEGDESDSSGKSRIFGSKRNRKKGEGLMKGFVLGTSSSRPSLGTRPSYESSRSGTRSKNSFDTIASNVSNSQGALHSLAQSSMTSTSLAVPSSEPSGKGSGLRNKFSIPRVRPRTPSTFSGQSALPNSPHAMSFNDSPTTSEFSHPSNLSSPRSSTSTSYHSQDFIHPYANPDLVVTHVQQLPKALQRAGDFGNIVRSDSISTITDSHSASSHSTLTHMTSISSLRQQSLPSPRVTNLTAKEISSPLSPLRPNNLASDKIREPKVVARPAAIGPAGIPGWIDNPGSPIQLISLVEAQAAKERARSATVNGGASDFLVPFPEADPNPSPTSSVNARSRARSISAGAKNALHNIVGGGPSPPKLDKGDSDSSLNTHGVPGKSLKHKKSGFMRLFNGKERETVPPVPTLSDAYTAHNNTSQVSVPRTTKMLLPRVPVPALASSAMNQPISSSSSLSGASDFGTTAIPRHPDSSPKRTPPSLSIITSTHSPRSPSANLSLPTIGATVKAQEDERLLSSAPPATTDFPSLSLRPVSTIFSAHFTDHIVAPEVGSPVDVELALDTPSSVSPSTGRSPLTPGFSVRSEGSGGDKASIVTGSGDQSSVIQALQSQIVSAKKAWQRHIWELEGQVRDLKAELEDLRTVGKEKEFCGVCGRGAPAEHYNIDTKKVGVVDRPRARTGDAARFGNGN